MPTAIPAPDYEKSAHLVNLVGGFLPPHTTPNEPAAAIFAQLSPVLQVRITALQ